MNDYASASDLTAILFISAHACAQQIPLQNRPPTPPNQHGVFYIQVYHHLFPLPPFKEAKAAKGTHCLGCAIALRAVLRNAVPVFLGCCCVSCESFLCEYCDEILHDSLHACPGCDGTY